MLMQSLWQLIELKEESPANAKVSTAAVRV